VLMLCLYVEKTLLETYYKYDPVEHSQLKKRFCEFSEFIGR
jgi:hypothetical protein